MKYIPFFRYKEGPGEVEAVATDERALPHPHSLFGNAPTYKGEETEPLHRAATPKGAGTRHWQLLSCPA